MTTTLSVAFLAGLISFLSPCVLPLITGYISYISGTSFDKLVKKKLTISDAAEPNDIKTKEKQKPKKIVLITTKLFFFSTSLSNDVPEM